jgi:hypothetical protein
MTRIIGIKKNNDKGCNNLTDFEIVCSNAAISLVWLASNDVPTPNENSNCFPQLYN